MKMHIPYVIDNTAVTLADILTALLRQYVGQSLDTATAYFNVGGFSLIKEGLQTLGSFRLLLGEAPEGAERIGLRPEKNIVRNRLVCDLNATPFSEKTLKYSGFFNNWLFCLKEHSNNGTATKNRSSANTRTNIETKTDRNPTAQNDRKHTADSLHS